MGSSTPSKIEDPSSLLGVIPRLQKQQSYSSSAGLLMTVSATVRIFKTDVGDSLAGQSVIGSPSGQTSNASPGFRFLDLPLEIRFQIYEEVVVVGKVFFTPRPHDMHNGVRCRGYKLFRKPELQLFRVCKQIQSEAEPIYLSKNLFVLPNFWHLKEPFLTEVLKESYCSHHAQKESQNKNERHLFSKDGLRYIKNISFAVDQEICPAGSFPDLSYWKSRKWDDGQRFGQRTGAEIFDEIHEMELEGFWDDMASMQYRLSMFKSRLSYVEVDYSNCFCPLGHCRPNPIWPSRFLCELNPEAVDVVGLQSADEREGFLSWRNDAYGLLPDELRGMFRLRFRKNGGNTHWDNLRMESEVHNGVGEMPENARSTAFTALDPIIPIIRTRRATGMSLSYSVSMTAAMTTSSRVRRENGRVFCFKVYSGGILEWDFIHCENTLTNRGTDRGWVWFWFPQGKTCIPPAS